MEKITVVDSKYRGSRKLYEGKSINQAIKIARRNTGSGFNAEIYGIDDNGNEFLLCDWETTPAFHPAKKPSWIDIN